MLARAGRSCRPRTRGSPRGTPPPRGTRRPGSATAATAGPCPRAISPARSSTFRCLETACSEIGNGSAISFTVASPCASRARIARRVGSASAANVIVSWSLFIRVVDQPTVEYTRRVKVRASERSRSMRRERASSLSARAQFGATARCPREVLALADSLVPRAAAGSPTSSSTTTAQRARRSTWSGSSGSAAGSTAGARPTPSAATSPARPGSRGRSPTATSRLGRAPSDRWWRRAALVSTVPLNLRAAGGTGDTSRTLAICEQLAADRDDMVVKALSWALRELSVRWDPDAVRAFLAHPRPRGPRHAARSPTSSTTGAQDPMRRRARPSALSTSSSCVFGEAFGITCTIVALAVDDERRPLWRPCTSCRTSTSRPRRRTRRRPRGPRRPAA